MLTIWKMQMTNIWEVRTISYQPWQGVWVVASDHSNLNTPINLALPRSIPKCVHKRDQEIANHDRHYTRLDHHH